MSVFRHRIYNRSKRTRPIIIFCGHTPESSENWETGVYMTNLTDWNDKVLTVDVQGGARQTKELSVTDFRTKLNTDPTGITEVRLDETHSLASLGAKYKTVTAIPAGAVVKYVALHVTTAVTAGGTTVKVGLGVQDGDMDKWGKTSDLTINEKFSNCFATALSAAENLDITGVTTAGTALGDTNISAGTVRVLLVYDKPFVPADV